MRPRPGSLTAPPWRGTRRMAQTDAKTGFRLPWSSDRQAADATDTDANESTEANAAGWPSDEAAPAVDEGERHDAPTVDPWTGIDAGATVEAADASVVPSPAPAAPAPSSRKPSKFLPDLTKAMQAAAEDARSRALSQLQADAKSHVEAIHGRSSTEAASLRRT